MLKRSKVLLALFLILATAHTGRGALNIVTLHPYLQDLAQEIGGTQVQVINLVPIGGDPHDYNLTPKDLVHIANANLVLAMGKNLESYLKKIQDNMSPDSILLEVGKPIPSCHIEPGGSVFTCCPAHSQGAVDPHWWHSISGMRRAVRYTAQTISTLDPQHEALYQSNAKTYRAALDELYEWATLQLSQIPKKNRTLTTTHASFGYFCEEFGFKAIPLQGLNKEHNPTPQYLVEAITIINQKQIPAIFPENKSNSKFLNAIARETGVKIGKTLLADAPSKAHSTYLAAYRYNVTAIVEALREEP